MLCQEVSNRLASSAWSSVFWNLMGCVWGGHINILAEYKPYNWLFMLEALAEILGCCLVMCCHIGYILVQTEKPSFRVLHWRNGQSCGSDVFRIAPNTRQIGLLEYLGLAARANPVIVLKEQNDTGASKSWISNFVLSRWLLKLLFNFSHLNILS